MLRRDLKDLLLDALRMGTTGVALRGARMWRRACALQMDGLLRIGLEGDVAHATSAARARFPLGKAGKEW
jgi:hypothetical protein